MEPSVNTVEFFQKSLLNELTELFGNIVTRTNARAHINLLTSFLEHHQFVRCSASQKGTLGG